MATHVVWANMWELLSADDARSTQRWLQTLIVDQPCLAPRAAMLPTFVRDGDLLLLDASGVVWLFSFWGTEHDFGPVAPTFDALIDRLLGPDIEGACFHLEFVWIDDVEYQVGVSHACSRNGCRIRFWCDLAPHVNRTGKDHALTLSFPEAQLAAPRSSSYAIIPTAIGPVDLRATEVVTRLVRTARDRGWTGRTGPLHVDDGLTWLDGTG
jgi:hypothetical protein